MIKLEKFTLVYNNSVDSFNEKFNKLISEGYIQCGELKLQYIELYNKKYNSGYGSTKYIEGGYTTKYQQMCLFKKDIQP